METTLLGFVFDVDLAGALVVEQHLPEYEFEVVLMHIVAGAGHFVVAHIRQIERRTVAVATRCHGVDVAAALQMPDTLLRP